MKPADLIDKDGKLRAKLPDGRPVEYDISDLGRPDATATARIGGHPAAKLDMSGTIRRLQRGDLKHGFQPADSLFDWPVQRVIEQYFPEKKPGYRYGGSEFAGSRIHHPGAIGDVGVPPANKFDWIWRTHDIQSFLLGHFEDGAVVHVTSHFPPTHGTRAHAATERYVSTRAEIIHAQALKATIDEMERRKPGSSQVVLDQVRTKVQTEVDSTIKHTRQELEHTIRDRFKRMRIDIWGAIGPSIRAVLEVNPEGDPNAQRLAGKIFQRGVSAIATLQGAMATAGLLDPDEVAQEQVFAELLTPPDGSSEESEGGKLAVRVSDFHECPMVTATVAHVGGPVSTGSGDIYIGGELAARLGDALVCEGPPDTMCMGSVSVFWNGRPAVRVMDATVHGGKTVPEDSKVHVG